MINTLLGPLSVPLPFDHPSKEGRIFTDPEFLGITVPSVVYDICTTTLNFAEALEIPNIERMIDRLVPRELNKDLYVTHTGPYIPWGIDGGGYITEFILSPDSRDALKALPRYVDWLHDAVRIDNRHIQLHNWKLAPNCKVQVATLGFDKDSSLGAVFRFSYVAKFPPFGLNIEFEFHTSVFWEPIL